MVFTTIRQKITKGKHVLCMSHIRRIFPNQNSLVKIPPISSCSPMSFLSKIKHQLFIQSMLIFLTIYIFFTFQNKTYTTNFLLVLMNSLDWGQFSNRELSRGASEEHTSQSFSSSYDRQRINTAYFLSVLTADVQVLPEL